MRRGLGITLPTLQTAGSPYPLNFTPGSDSLTNDNGGDTFKDGDTATVHHGDGSTSPGGTFYQGKWFPGGTSAGQAAADAASLQQQQQKSTAMVAQAAGLTTVPYVSAAPATATPAAQSVIRRAATVTPITVGVASRPVATGAPRVQPMDSTSGPAPMIPPQAPAAPSTPLATTPVSSSSTLFGLPIWLVAVAGIGAVLLFGGGKNAR